MIAFRIRSLILVSLICVGVLLSLSFSAPAQAEEEDDSTIVIQGRILRPQASYIIQRANIDFGVGMKKKSFVHKIEESLNEKPFQ